MSEREWGTRAKRSVGEFVMIVLGVLVALSADSWWSDHREQRDVDELLSTLRVELEENSRALKDELTRRRGLVADSRRLISLMNGEPPIGAPDSLMNLVFSTMTWTDPTLSFGSYDILLSRGSADFVDAGFMSRLSAHVTDSRRGYAVDLPLWDANLQRANDLITAHGGLLAIGTPEFRASRQLPEPIRTADFEGLLAVAEFSNVATLAYILHDNYRDWLEKRLAETDSLLVGLQ